MVDKPVYPISTVGNCARTLSANRLGLFDEDGEIPIYLAIAAREGRRHEVFIREDLPEHGWTPINTEGVECQKCGRDGYHVDLDMEDFIFTGHIDDFVRPLDSYTDIHLAEYKALGRFTSDSLKRNGIEAHRTYATQVSLYHYGIELPILYVVKNRDTGFMKVMEIEAPLELDDIVSRVVTIEDHVSEGVLAPCDFEDGQIDKWSCTSLCDSLENTPGFIAEDGVIPNSVKDAFQDLKRANDIKQELKSIDKEARSAVLAFMQASNTKRMEIDGIMTSLIPDGWSTKHEIPDEVKAAFAIKKERPAYIRVTDKREER